jgi:hypothetical protein
MSRIHPEPGSSAPAEVASSQAGLRARNVKFLDVQGAGPAADKELAVEGINAVKRSSGSRTNTSTWLSEHIIC